MPNAAGSIRSSETSPAGWWWLDAEIDGLDRPALIGADGWMVTRAELASAVRSSAGYLLDEGLDPGERLGLSLVAGPARAAAVLAAMAVAPLVPLVRTGPMEVVKDDLRRLRVGRLVVDGQPSVEAVRAAEALRIPVIRIDPFSASARRIGPLPSRGPDDIALVLQSSGTTSRPKIVPLTHANLRAGALSVVDTLRLTPADRCLAAMPMFHIHGIVATLLAPLVAGGSVICCRERAVKELVAQLTALRPTWFSAAPPILLALLDEVERVGVVPPLHHLRFLRSVTMPLSSQARDRLEAVFRVPVLEVYGMTEASSQVSSTRLAGPESDRQPGTVGLPAGPEVAILSADGAHCPPGVVGEIAIRGPCVTRGYEGEGENGWSLDARGEPWFLTGDEGRFDEQGHLTLCGRIKEMINRGGMKVAPARVDEALARHPAVEDAVAFAIPHPTLGEDVAAAVVTVPGAMVDEQTLREHLIATVAAHEVPSRIVFVESLPRGDTGKPRRIGLADRLADMLVPSPAPALDGLEPLVAEIFANVIGIDPPGRDANFFLLGGDSLSSLEVVNRLQQAIGVDLNAAIVFLDPVVRDLARRLERRVAEEEAVATDGQSIAVPPRPPATGKSLPGRPRRGIAAAEALAASSPPGMKAYPASFAQARLWFLHQMDPGLTAYHLTSLWRLRGPLDRTALRQAFTGLIARHAALRTSFRLDGDRLHQIIHPPSPFSLVPECLGERGVEAVIDDWQRHEASTAFDLESGLLLRGRLLEVGPEDHLLLIDHHHIASDGWSRNVICDDLAALYNSACLGLPPSRPDPAVRYQDYAVWQRERLHGPRLDDLREFWARQLDGLGALAMPATNPAPTDEAHDVRAVSFGVGHDILAPFEEICRSQGATLHMGLLAAVAVLLHRHSRQDDFAIGIPMWGRNDPDLESLVGFFVNTLPIRVRFDRRPSFRDLLGQVRDTSIEAYAHQELPFEQIVKVATGSRDAVRVPLVSVMLQFVSMPLSSLAGMHGLEVERLDVRPGAARFDLEFMVRHNGQGGLLGELIYDAGRFAPAAVDRLVLQLVTLLESLVRAPDASTDRLPPLPASEREQLGIWQRGPDVLPVGEVVHELVERQVQQSPDAVAVAFGRESLTYAELNASAERLATHLIDQGAAADGVVAVCLERSVHQMITILAILKAGAAYLPVDPAWPRRRQQGVLEASAATLLVTDQDSASIGATAYMRTINPAKFDSGGRGDRISPRPRSSEESLAYVLYTSGSTGEPKGVAMPHGPLVNLLTWQSKCMGQRARTLQFASLGFDVSFQEVFSTWAAGGTLVLVSETVRRNPSALLRMLEREGIERLFLPVVMLAHLAEASESDDCFPDTLRQVIVAGEQLRVTPSIRRFFGRLPQCRLWNHYGPTETHVATGYQLPADPATWPDLPPIGRPIANAEVKVLDEAMEAVPIGVSGEIYIGGAAVARGYWRRPELTRERFVVDPDGIGPNSRLYRTGDHARWRNDGELEFLGRTDHQVKIRGQRVELGEIEAVLASHPKVQAAAVVVRESGRTTRVLVAFVTGFSGSDAIPADVRAWLQTQLPEVMVPAEVVVLQELPVNDNGKIDRTALERLARASERHAQSAADPGDAATDRAIDSQQKRTPLPTILEAEIRDIWQRLFTCDAVDLTADFFQMGGDSLMAVEMAVELDRLLGRRIPIATLFESPTIRSLARTLADESWMPAWKSLVALHPSGSRLPLFVVHGMGGEVFYAARFARLLGPDQPVYGIRADDTGEGEIPSGGVEAIAGRYVAEIRALQPDGPYRVAGYSVGGWFAYAVATELRDQGQEVRLLVFDTNPSCRLHWPARGPQVILKVLASISGLSYHTRAMAQMPRGEWPRYIGSRLLGVVRGFAPAARKAPSDTESSDRFTRAVRRFTARSIDARVDYFQARAPWIPRMVAIFQAAAWRWLVRGPMTVHGVSCHHVEMFAAGNVAELAAKVRGILDDTPAADAGACGSSNGSSIAAHV